MRGIGAHERHRDVAVNETYINGDNTECLVFERYRDSQAQFL